ncbi:MAG: ATP synthase F0 subunit C [Alphaproteobacteria bacterium]|nr:ATP synthase F0 subunit C [Alphaproteobacteria bacterium]
METDTNLMLQFAEGMKYLSIGLVSFVMIAAAKGVASVFTTIISCISRNPNVKNDVSIFAWVGAGMVEGIALFALGLAFMLL